MKGKFLSLPRATIGSASEARREIHHALRAYDSVSSHHALRACEINRFAIGKRFAQRLVFHHQTKLLALKAQRCRPPLADGTSALSAREVLFGGPDRDRTGCLVHAMDALYQVSYGPFSQKTLLCVGQEVFDFPA